MQKNDDYTLGKEDKREVSSVYSESKLDFDTIKKNPILKPIAELNNSYINFELLINRALWEFGEDKEAIDSMIEANPKYSETILLGKIQSILGHIKQIIHSQDIQKQNMKNAINEMIKIVGENYGLLEDETGMKEKESVKESVKSVIAQRENGVKEESKENSIEEKIEKTDEEENFKYSELVERPIPKPKTSKDNEFIPIKN